MQKTARGNRAGSPNFPLTCKADWACKFYCLPYLLSSPILSVTAFKGTCDAGLQRYKRCQSLPHPHLPVPYVNAEQPQLLFCVVWGRVKWLMGFRRVLDPGHSAVPPPQVWEGTGAVGPWVSLLPAPALGSHRGAVSAGSLCSLVPPSPSQPLSIRSWAGTSLPSLSVTLSPLPGFHWEKKRLFSFPHPAQLSATDSDSEVGQDDLRDLPGLGQYPREGRVCVGVCCHFPS